QAAGRAGMDRIGGARAADVEPVSESPAEAQVGDRLRDVDLAEQVAAGVVAAHAVLARIAPTDRAPDIAGGIGAHAIADAGLWHFGEHLAVGHLAAFDIDIEVAQVR